MWITPPKAEKKGLEGVQWIAPLDNAQQIIILKNIIICWRLFIIFQKWKRLKGIDLKGGRYFF